MTKNDIEVRITERDSGTVLDVRSLTEPSDVTAAVEDLLAGRREDCRVFIFAGGEQWEMQDLVCTGCGRDLDSQPGWSFSGEHAAFEIHCPRVARRAA